MQAMANRKSPEDAQHALKRMLANGALTALPKRPSDQALLAQLAASRFGPQKEYREKEVNEELARWLGTFCEPHGIDHVTMRRLMVDSRLLMRDKPGSSYRVNPGEVEEPAAEPADVLAQVEKERQARKEKHGG
jgi:hypothetical protein